MRGLAILAALALAAAGLPGCRPREEPPTRKRVVVAMFSGTIGEERALAREVESAKRMLARFGAGKQYLGSMCWQLWAYEKDAAAAKRMLAKAKERGRFRHLWCLPGKEAPVPPDASKGGHLREEPDE